MLASKLFQLPASKYRQDCESEKHSLRSELFELLSCHFPESMTHPRGNLIDLIQYPIDTN